MTITWIAARAKVRGDLWRTESGIPDDVVDRALHASILELESADGRNWLWLEEINGDLEIAVAASDVAAPADCSSVQSLCYRRTDGDMLDPPLSRVSLAQVRVAASSNNSAGYPTCYAFSQDRFYFDCQLPAGSSLDLVYTARTSEDLDTAVAGGDTNTTLQLQQTAVIANACSYVALNFLKNDDEARRKRAVYERILERLANVEDSARGDLGGGFVRPDTYYYDMARGG